ncbi:DUF4129 domain-containing protein [Arthrobacter sp. SA17]
MPLPGGGAAGAAGFQLLPVLYGALGVLLLGLLLASPRLIRTGLRSRRLRLGPAASDDAALQSWAELRDLAIDYGVPPRPSETPRHFSARLRRSGALGEEDSRDAAAHRAVDSLVQDFERREYGRPLRPQAAPGESRPGATPAAIAAARIDLIIAALRANARRLVRFRASWLPPAVMDRWLSTLGTPFRAVSRRVAAWRRAAARTLVRTRDGLRRVREG